MFPAKLTFSRGTSLQMIWKFIKPRCKGGCRSTFAGNSALLSSNVIDFAIGNLRTTTKFTTTTSVDWEKTGTRRSVSAGKRKVKMQSVGRSTTTTLNVNTDVEL